MKKSLFAALAIVLAFTATAQDDQAVKDVINQAYVGGIHNGGPIADIRKGFHPAFVMLRLADNEVKQTTLEDWVKSTEDYRAKNPTPPATKAEAKYVNVAVVGTSANVTLELYRGDKKIFTDHLLLYKFAEGWRIVGKSFYRHP